MDKILCVSEIIFSFSDPRQQITDELRYMKTRLNSYTACPDSKSQSYNCRTYYGDNVLHSFSING